MASARDHDALAAREQELAAIYGNVPAILFYVAVEPDGEFRFLSMSRAGLQAMGLSPAQVVGALVRDVIPPSSCDLVLERYREAIRSRGTVRWKEVSMYPAGRKIGEVAVTPFYDGDGEATHLIGIVNDITEREAELEQLNGRLRTLVSQQKLAEHRARERLATTMNDELQQVLFGVSLILARVEHDAAGSPLADTIAQARTDVEQAMTAARSLSLELLPPVLVDATLPAAIEWLGEWTHSKYGLVVDVTADQCATIDRKDLFTLVFESVRELLLNVVRHARVDRASVDLAVGPDGMLALTVSDAGAGFDVAALSDKESKAHHLGVGIFSIRERLALLGGRLEVESAPGKGTTCRLIVPVAPISPRAESSGRP